MVKFFFCLSLWPETMLRPKNMQKERKRSISHLLFRKISLVDKRLNLLYGLTVYLTPTILCAQVMGNPKQSRYMWVANVWFQKVSILPIWRVIGNS